MTRLTEHRRLNAKEPAAPRRIYAHTNAHRKARERAEDARGGAPSPRCNPPTEEGFMIEIILTRDVRARILWQGGHREIRLQKGERLWSQEQTPTHHYATRTREPITDMRIKVDSSAVCRRRR